MSGWKAGKIKGVIDTGMEPTKTKLSEQVETFLKQNPDVARALEVWSASSGKYEEAVKGLMTVPRVYVGGSSTAAPPVIATGAARR